MRGELRWGRVGRDALHARLVRRPSSRAIGSDRVVIVEPDSLGTIDCHARSRRDDRIRLLRYGVSVLSQLPNATIYIEATASDWEPARRVAKLAPRRRRRQGARVHAERDLHYDWTTTTSASASRFRAGRWQALGDQHGRERPRADPLPHARGRRINVWCNPGLPRASARLRRRPRIPRSTRSRINRPGYAQSCQHRRSRGTRRARLAIRATPLYWGASASRK